MTCLNSLWSLGQSLSQSGIAPLHSPVMLSVVKKNCFSQNTNIWKCSVSLHRLKDFLTWAHESMDFILMNPHPLPQGSLLDCTLVAPSPKIQGLGRTYYSYIYSGTEESTAFNLCSTQAIEPRYQALVWDPKSHCRFSYDWAQDQGKANHKYNWTAASSNSFL